MTEVEGVEIATCAICEGEVEVFTDDVGFSCPYCGTENVFIDDSEESDDSEELEDEITTSNILTLNRSVTTIWCSRHKEATEHAWVSDRRFGQRQACLVCWPSKRPAHPIYHRKEEEV